VNVHKNNPEKIQLSFSDGFPISFLEGHEVAYGDITEE